MKVCLAVFRVAAAVLLPAVAFAVPAARTPQKEHSASSSAAASMKRKLRHLDANAAAARPDSSPTVFTENEINAYLASGNVLLPAGVKSVHLAETPGVVTASTRVDFDQVRAGQNSVNPLLAIFSGIHDVVVVAHAHGSAGQGVVHVDSVSLDGVEIPRFVLQLFVQAFLQPRYPEIGLDSRFDLPDRIDTAVVGLHELTVTQRQPGR